LGSPAAPLAACNACDFPPAAGIAKGGLIPIAELHPFQASCLLFVGFCFGFFFAARHAPIAKFVFSISAKLSAEGRCLFSTMPPLGGRKKTGKKSHENQDLLSVVTTLVRMNALICSYRKNSLVFATPAQVHKW